MQCPSNKIKVVVVAKQFLKQNELYLHHELSFEFLEEKEAMNEFSPFAVQSKLWYFVVLNLHRKNLFEIVSFDKQLFFSVQNNPDMRKKRVEVGKEVGQKKRNKTFIFFRLHFNFLN